MAKPELEFFDTSVLPWQEIQGAPGQYEKLRIISQLWPCQIFQRE